MTLGIAFIGSNYAGLVTDRKLTGVDTTIDSDKCGWVQYVDGRFAYTFAGLAEVPYYKFVTRHALPRILCEAGRPGVGVAEALPRVAELLSIEVQKMPVVALTDRHLSLILGWFPQKRRWFRARRVPHDQQLRDAAGLDAPGGAEEGLRLVFLAADTNAVRCSAHGGCVP